MPPDHLVWSALTFLLSAHTFRTSSYATASASDPNLENFRNRQDSGSENVSDRDLQIVRRERLRIVLTRKPASFSRENEVVVLISGHSTTSFKRECRSGGNSELSNVRSCSILQSGEGLTSFNNVNSALLRRKVDMMGKTCSSSFVQDCTRAFLSTSRFQSTLERKQQGSARRVRSFFKRHRKYPAVHFLGLNLSGATCNLKRKKFTLSCCDGEEMNQGVLNEQSCCFTY